MKISIEWATAITTFFPLRRDRRKFYRENLIVKRRKKSPHTKGPKNEPLSYVNMLSRKLQGKVVPSLDFSTFEGMN